MFLVLGKKRLRLRRRMLRAVRFTMVPRVGEVLEPPAGV